MFIVVLRFAEAREKAKSFMAEHNAFIQRGFDDGVFILVGSLRPAEGGLILARGGDRQALEQRLSTDPFVIHGIVHVEFLEVAPSRGNDALLSLLT